MKKNQITKEEAISDSIDKNSLKIIKEQQSYESIFINYFDLGLRDGWELDEFLKFVSSFNIKYKVYGIEACKKLYDKLHTKYIANPNIEISHLAISSKDDQLIKLYHSKNYDGNSIFKTKNNLLDVDKNFEMCKTKRISTFIQDIKKSNNTINIIKANIEGAEYDVIKDLQMENKLDYFDYYIGAGWTTDMYWIEELQSKIQEIKQILKNNNIKTYYFARGWNEKNNINFNDLIHS